MRAIAVLLVILGHHPRKSPFSAMGWIGVDLFFVISGFLISTLLFNEYQKTGKINILKFMIRRSIKIIPLFYLTYPLYLTPYLIPVNFKLSACIPELFFFQNYDTGFGYSNPPSWSLAVEMHFYLLVAIILYIAAKNKTITPEETHQKHTLVSLKNILFLILIFIFLIRFFQNYTQQFPAPQLYAMSHLRIDSLIAGVLLSYFFHFKSASLISFYRKYKFVLFSIAFIFIAWTPFLNPIESVFIRTFGFSMLYIALSITLLICLISENLIERLSKFMGSKVMLGLITIGAASYPIYLIHWFFGHSTADFMNTMVKKSGYLPENLANGFLSSADFVFILGSTLSIATGIILNRSVEKFILNLRDKILPSAA